MYVFLLFSTYNARIDYHFQMTPIDKNKNIEIYLILKLLSFEIP